MMETWRKGKRFLSEEEDWGGQERDAGRGRGRGTSRVPMSQPPNLPREGFWHSAQMSSLSPVLTQLDPRAQDSGPSSFPFQLFSPGALPPLPGPLLPAADLWLQPGGPGPTLCWGPGSPELHPCPLVQGELHSHPGTGLESLLYFRF